MSGEDFSYFNDAEFKKHLSRYEKMLGTNQPVYLEADELTDIAEFYMISGETEKATECINYARSLHPDCVDPFIFMARQKLFANDIEGAKAIRKQFPDENDREVIFFDAELLMHEKKLTEAAAYIEKASRRMDDDMESFAYDIAYLYIDYGLFEIADTWCEKVLAIHPASDRNLKLKGEILSGLNRQEEAIDILNRALDINPYNIYAWQSLTEVYILLGDYVKANETIDFALAINETDPRSLQMKGHCLFYQNNFHEAHRYYEASIDVFPVDAMNYLYDGISLFNIKDYENARTQLKKGCKYARTDQIVQQQIHIQLSMLYSKQGDVKSAIDEIETANNITPLEHHINIFKGNIYLENNRPVEALECFNSAIAESRPEKKAETSLYIGIAYAECFHYKEAESYLRSVLESENRTSANKAYAYLSLCALKRDDIKTFLSFLKSACEVDDPFLEVALGSYFPEEIETNEFYDYVITHPEWFLKIKSEDKKY